jgi:5-formyltetrahydrofolate cyclo-ligase
MRSMLKALDAQTRHALSIAACTRLVALEAFEHAQNIMMYLPLAQEVDVTPAVLRCFQSSKTVCVPKVDWNRQDMSPVEITSLDDRVMDIDEHGVRSPRAGNLILPSTINLVIVPGLAYDPSGHRLGRGGGYYDRFLRRLRPSATIVGLAFDQQVIDSPIVA